MHLLHVKVAWKVSTWQESYVGIRVGYQEEVANN